MIAVDHIGCGPLATSHSGMSIHWPTHVQNLIEFIEGLDLRDIYVGRSRLGRGRLGSAAAVQLPSRFSRFVMFNTAAFPPPFFPWRIRICRMPIVGTVATARNEFVLVSSTPDGRRTSR